MLLGKKENGTLKHKKQNKDEEIFKDSAKCSLGMCHRVLVFTPKKGEFKLQQVQLRGAGKGRGKGPILGKELKNTICFWPRMLGEDVMPVYKYRGNVNTREGSKLISLEELCQQKTKWL